MKTVLKKTSVALVALGISVGAMANGGTVPMPTGFNVTVPHQDAGWALGIEGMYWQPNMHNLAYAVTGDDVSNGSNTIDAKVHTVEPDYGWGFSLWGTYFFEGQGNDITLRWTRFHDDDSDSVNDSDDGSESVTPVKGFPEQGGEDTWEHGDSTADFEYDAVDLMLGQHIDVGPSLDLHLAAGLRYASLDTQVHDHFEKPDGGSRRQDVKLFRDIRYDSDFTGIGPRVEADAMYDFGSGFGFVAGAGGSIIIGENDVKSSDHLPCSVADDCNEGGDAYDLTSFDKGETQQVVPEVDGKIGVNYVYNMGGNSSIAIEAGWKATTYFEAHQRMHPIENSTDTRDMYFVETAANVTFQGPYVNLEYRAS